MRVIDAEQVRRLLPLVECIDLMAHAMRAASNGQIAVSKRLVVPLVDDSAQFMLMPGSTLEPRVYGAKLINVHPGNAAHGRPLHQGFVALFDHDTGAVLAIVEGAEITALRTAAASGLATRVLASGDAKTHGVFGAGPQAASHIQAIAAVRSVERVVIWARKRASAEQLASDLKGTLDCDIVASADPEVAGRCDIVTTVTTSREPVVRGAWIRPGTHLNVVGAHTPTTREVDDATVAKSAIYVDLMQSALSEAGDLLIPMKSGMFHPSSIMGEIGQVLSGEVLGRTDAAQITLYKSLGIVAQDLIAAAHVYQRAVAQDLGTVVRL